VGNEVITLVKDTSLANFIMVGEIIKVAKDFGNKAMIWPLFYAGVFFLVFNGVVTLALSRAEKRLDYFRV
jgi:polar amino acid transport system permease protein